MVFEQMFPAFFRGVQDTDWYRRFLQTALPPVVARGSAPRVLDFGTGPGGLLELLRRASPAADCVGLDVDRAMLTVARRRPALAGVELRFLERGAALPFPAASFDAVCAVAVLFLLPEPAVVARQLLGLLRPGGVLVVVTPGRGCGWRAAVDPRFVLWRYATRRRARAWAAGTVLPEVCGDHDVAYSRMRRPSECALLELCTVAAANGAVETGEAHLGTGCRGGTGAVTGAAPMPDLRPSL